MCNNNNILFLFSSYFPSHFIPPPPPTTSQPFSLFVLYLTMMKIMMLRMVHPFRLVLNQSNIFIFLKYNVTIYILLSRFILQ